MPPWARPPRWTRCLCGTRGQGIPQDFVILAGELAESEHVLKYPQEVRRDLHHQRHRGLQPAALKSDQVQIGVPIDDSLFKMLYPAMMDITQK